MATNMGPIILGLGAAFLFLRKKDSSANGDTDIGRGDPEDWSQGGYGGGTPEGDSPCQVLEGIWAPVGMGANSPLAAVTSNVNLRNLPLTLEAFEAADLEFQSFFQANPELKANNMGDHDLGSIAGVIQERLTEDLGCPWGNPEQWTNRMQHLNGAVNMMLTQGIKPGGMFWNFVAP